MAGILGLASLMCCSLASATSQPAPQSAARPAFDIVALGVEGGLMEGATSAWYIARHGSERGLTCDAGTLVPGITTAIARGTFAGDALPMDVLHNRIAAYLITHPHLDHVAGLVMASPDDTPKPIFALAEVNAALASDYFNWRAWPNMGDRGTAPLLGRYHYQDVAPGGAPTTVAGTGLTVTAYPLAHGGTLSSAFLIRAGDDALLCMGDTGPDSVEHSTRLDALWQSVAPLLRDGHLRAIIIETSYPDPRPDSELYGHLTPSHLHRELRRLAERSGDGQRMEGLPIIIGHIKPALDGTSYAIRERILDQLTSRDSPPVRYILPRQGDALRF